MDAVSFFLVFLAIVLMGAPSSGPVPAADRRLPPRPRRGPDSGLFDDGFDSPWRTCPRCCSPLTRQPADVDRLRFPSGCGVTGWTRWTRCWMNCGTSSPPRTRKSRSSGRKSDACAHAAAQSRRAIPRTRRATPGADAAGPGRTAAAAGLEHGQRDGRASPARAAPGSAGDRGAAGGRGGSRWPASTWRPGWSVRASSWPRPCTRASIPGSRPSPTTGTSSTSGMRAGTGKSSERLSGGPADGRGRQRAGKRVGVLPAVSRPGQGACGRDRDAPGRGLTLIAMLSRPGRGPGGLQPVQAQGRPRHGAVGTVFFATFPVVGGPAGALRRVR